MRISIAQTRPIKGDIQRNIERHMKFVSAAGANRADVIIFPELSLTGYEPALAESLAAGANDTRFDVFQDASDKNAITIGAGVPTQSNSGICISLLLCRPLRPKRLYSKMFLHPDELPFFVAGEKVEGLVSENRGVALAICYELSIPEHAATAFNDGAHTYIASVAKSAGGVDKATQRLAEIARDYSMTVFMANSVGPADGFQCAGKSSVWNRKGELLVQMDNESEGIIIHDTVSQEIIVVKS